jgi:hypothetical protein
MKIIVTHIGPDLDAICATWLIKSFFPGWEEAAFAFVPAGTTLNKLPPDDNPDVIHVDTGFGKYDHHQSNSDTCAAKLVEADVINLHGSDTALERLVAVVNDIDHFREVFFPNPTADFWEFSIVAAIDGWRLLYAEDPYKTVNLGMETLDGIYKTFQNKIWAEKELLQKGKLFDSPWGKSVALETTNDETVHLGQKMGYAVVVRKDPKKGYLRIKTLPKESIDLEKAYTEFLKRDPKATWFLHASHHMILNGSAKNPDMKPTTLTLEEIIKIIQQNG